jgi:hypothetical protein
MPASPISAFRRPFDGLLPVRGTTSPPDNAARTCVCGPGATPAGFGAGPPFGTGARALWTGETKGQQCPVRPKPSALLVLLVLLLVACAPVADPAATGQPEGGTLALIAAEIEIAEDGRCYGRDVTPAVIETVTVAELDAPAVLAEDGTVLSPATYRTVTRQEITRERGEVRFETLCPPAYTVEFVATLQRALATRGLYAGPITGVLDSATGRAVQDFQRDDGPDSPLLSIDAARRLGIVALSPDQIAAL